MKDAQQLLLPLGIIFRTYSRDTGYGVLRTEHRLRTLENGTHTLYEQPGTLRITTPYG